MTWLERAVATGYNDVDAMKTGNDLGALRDRADFKELPAGRSRRRKNNSSTN